ncbi:helix-turn-helix domain-containing protein [Sphingobium yanoikuyae]|uniref:helix-turn-helix domain-containing protein n=1 Tax=Sphingobium yanoikuyae TaxID=13690 RepID=UPI00345F13ED
MGAQVFSVASLADHWGCGTDTVYSLIRGGSLRAFKLGGKLLRIRADEVERFECQTTPCNDTENNSPSSGQMRMDAATDIRLERLIERRPRPQLVSSGNAER